MTTVKHLTITVIIAAVTFTALPLAADTGVEPPEPYQPAPTIIQTGVGLGVSTGLAIGSLTLMGRHIRDKRAAEPGAIWSYRASLATAASAPLLVPLSVNLVGNLSGYPNQYLGAQLGGIAGSLAIPLLTLSAALVAPRATSLYAEIALFGYFGGIVAGSVIGYHTQASMRQNRDPAESAATGVTPMISPEIDPQRDEWTLTVGWQGRF